MNVTVLGALLLAHMIADYPLQSNWMAKNKHNDTDALTAHVIIHGVVAFLALAPVHIGLAAGLVLPYAFMHGVVDRMDLHIRWDQTAHLCIAVALTVIV